MAFTTTPTAEMLPDGSVSAPTLIEVRSNGTQPSDPPAGYVATDGDGNQVDARPLNDVELAELAALDEQQSDHADRATLLAAASDAMASNTGYMPNAGTATAAQVRTQVASITRQLTVIERLLLRLHEKGLDGS